MAAVYARLPDRLGDPDLKKRAIDLISAYVDHAIEFSRKRAFDLITGDRTDMPMILVSRFFCTLRSGGFALTYARSRPLPSIGARPSRGARPGVKRSR